MALAITATVASAQSLPRLKVSMRWSFVSGAKYTKVLTLLVRGVPAGSQVLLTCHGGGCPFARSTLDVVGSYQCVTKGKHRCSEDTTVDLSSRFAKRLLHPGTKITVKIVRSGWTGRSYTFVIRAHRPPRTAAAWVA